MQGAHFFWLLVTVRERVKRRLEQLSKKVKESKLLLAGVLGPRLKVGILDCEKKRKERIGKREVSRGEER